MPSLRLDHWSFAVALSLVFGGCVFHCGDHAHDGDDGYWCEGPGCYDDDDGYGTKSSSGSGNDGGGGEGQGAGGGDGGGGGAPECPPENAPCTCSIEVPCPGDLACINGLCQSTCGFDYDCGPGLVCGNGECVPACDADAPCEAGYACVGGGCLVDPANPACVDETSCGGLECLGGFCTNSCLSHADCGTGQVCSPVVGGCIVDSSPVPLCDDSSPCAGTGQSCLEGVCHYECLEVLDCKLIDARFDFCDRGFCKTDLEMNPQCTAADPCPRGEACVSNVCAR